MAPTIRRLVLALLLTSQAGLLASGCAVPDTPPAPGSVLFQDDFSRPSSGWEIRRRTDSILEYRGGEYVMLVLVPESSIWSTPGLSVGDVRIEVDARQTAGSVDNLYGVVCRYKDDGNFAFLVASSDGFAGIGEYRDGGRLLLSGEAMLPVESIMPAGLPNHLSAECLGDTLRLYINGSLAAEAGAEAEVPEGGVGLLVGSYREPGVEIAFDNFSARAP